MHWNATRRNKLKIVLKLEKPSQVFLKYFANQKAESKSDFGFLDWFGNS